MPVAEIFMPENRLGAIIGDAADPTTSRLARAAELRVDTLKAGLLLHVASHMQIIRRLARQSDDVALLDCGELGEAAQAICEVAGAAGLYALGEAARGVFIMVAAQGVQGLWRPEALKAHLNAMVMIDGEPDPDHMSGRHATILEELLALRTKIGIAH